MIFLPLDFFGIHFDLTFPDVNNSAIHVTGGEFQLISDPDAEFGVGPGIPVDMVPDSGSTLSLLIVGMIGLLGARGKLSAGYRIGGGSVATCARQGI
jgi:hypothetical protein